MSDVNAFALYTEQHKEEASRARNVNPKPTVPHTDVPQLLANTRPQLKSQSPPAFTAEQLERHSEYLMRVAMLLAPEAEKHGLETVLQGLRNVWDDYDKAPWDSSSGKVQPMDIDPKPGRTPKGKKRKTPASTAPATPVAKPDYDKLAAASASNTPSTYKRR